MGWYMKIHEYQAKDLLAAEGAKIPVGIIANSPEEAIKAFDQLGGKPVVLKAQVHAGGRGKGRFKDSGKDFGGVKFITKREDIIPIAEVMFKYPLVTLQTGPEGQKVSKILVQSAADISREIYLGMVLDRAEGLPIMMACADGGVDIEEVAHKNPEKLLKMAVSPETGLLPYQARKLAFELGFTPEQVPQAEAIMMALSKVFLAQDANLAEINPLVVTPTGEVLALDAKITFDDNAMFRHADLKELRDLNEEEPAEIRAANTGLSYVKLDGNIGCLVNGAGLAMATMDIIKHHGGAPANFLDVGGGANTQQVTEAFRIILSDPNVKAILVNIFGGIARCTTIAQAIIEASKEVGFTVPLVVRLEGTEVNEGKKMLRESGLAIISAEDLTDAAKKVVASIA